MEKERRRKVGIIYDKGTGDKAEHVLLLLS